ncbi:bacillithiol biosynthesis BshC [Bacillus licheniformis]|nr:bacillithiol biosynthesis BshC [Bacillus licheniformis]
MKELHLQWSEAELCDLICQNPEAFSNNVVTRPLMQEYLLPTLAFIAGPGEINYWGELKGAFQVMGYKMPPVVPRLQVTFLERHIEKSWTNGESNSANRLKGSAGQKEQYFKIRFRTDLPIRSNRRKKNRNIHSAVRAEALEIDGSLGPLLEKTRASFKISSNFGENSHQKD